MALFPPRERVAVFSTTQGGHLSMSGLGVSTGVSLGVAAEIDGSPTPQDVSVPGVGLPVRMHCKTWSCQAVAFQIIRLRRKRTIRLVGAVHGGSAGHQTPRMWSPSPALTDPSRPPPKMLRFGCDMWATFPRMAVVSSRLSQPTIRMAQRIGQMLPRFGIHFA